MSQKKVIQSAMGAAFLAAACLSSPAQALEPKQCLSMAEMNAALRAEGQRTMIIGDRQALQNPTGKIEDADILRYVNTVTSNDDGSLGYQLEGDLPRAQASTNVCVRAKLTNVRLYDANRAAIPQAVFLGGKFDDVVRGHAVKGIRPMMIADTLHPTGNGNDRMGLPLVMFGNAARKTASLETKLSDGSPQFLMLMADTEYTAAGRARLNPQVAVNEPR